MLKDIRLPLIEVVCTRCGRHDLLERKALVERFGAGVSFMRAHLIYIEGQPPRARLTYLTSALKRRQRGEPVQAQSLSLWLEFLQH